MNSLFGATHFQFVIYPLFAYLLSLQLMVDIVLFILDGKIASEYLTGVYDETRDDLKAREKDTAAWLVGMKF